MLIKHPRSRRAAGFTLVELIVVMGIIAVLISLLLPALNNVRESARATACASNLSQAGNYFHLFSQDHEGRFPYSQLANANQNTPWWTNVMYLHDYFELVDRYGMTSKILLCPSSSAAEQDISPVEYYWGNWTEAQARQVSAGLSTLGPVYGPQDLGPANDPENPTGGGAGIVTDFADFQCYAYMGFNNQWGGNGAQPAQVAIGVLRPGTPTQTHTSYDLNPPLMFDQTFYQPGVGLIYNHGKKWQIISADASGNAKSQNGNPLVNVLFADNHVEMKTPDNHPYVVLDTVVFMYH